MNNYKNPSAALNLVGSIFAIVGILLALFGVEVFCAKNEALTFNRLCNAHVTTWDALFVSLRVDDCINRPAIADSYAWQNQLNLRNRNDLPN